LRSIHAAFQAIHLKNRMNTAFLRTVFEKARQLGFLGGVVNQFIMGKTLVKRRVLALLTPLADDMNRLDAVIRSRLNSNVVLVRTIADYIIGAGGKRLRPALLLLVARALNTQGKAADELAAVIEFIHTATLLHDDVVDESTLRRGRKTANAQFGNAASVLVGDFLYSRAFQMMVEVANMRIMRILADATNTIAEGEVLQLLNTHDPDVTIARYMQVIEFKTAKLFEAAAQLPAVLAGASSAVEHGLAEYGRKLGSAFQLIDDVLDYQGDVAATGKNLGDDLREGKVTLPLIHVATHGNTTQKALVRSAIESGGAGQFEAIVAAVHETGALTATQATAERQAAAAKAALELLHASPEKTLLLTLADFSVQRDH
jgi:octaprenyl-diphosphate synthase